MRIANSFPVFEADQVLTNQHLNDLFNYLDQQNRLSRCKLLGSGIVCGLEISGTSDTINITKGCGLTSQGYIMLLCDHTGENGYKYYTPFTKPPFPADLEMISQCGDPDLTHVRFFSSPDDAAMSAPDDIQLLQTQSDYDALSDKTQSTALSQGGDLTKYAVVLFLDANELKLKNCDTNDCNDKGSVMDLEVKVLLVNKNLLTPGNNNGNNGKLSFSPIRLRRYNVPVSNLNSSADVLNAFVHLLTSDSILDTLANDLKFCYVTYQSLLSGTNNYSFGSGADFKNTLNNIRQIFPFLLQYYYDFIYDLILAVYEFRYKAHAITSECCGDEMRFPFHLMLGEAAANAGNAVSAYRQYFIYSPLFDGQAEGANELRSLLMRMILMHQGYALFAKSIQKGLPSEIKITPSTWGRGFLSERCIPYYYKTVHDNTDIIAEDLYYYWSYEKTKRGRATVNLSYDPTPYNTSNFVVNPLYFDIEWYDFFRIEGHIGKPINTALSDLVSKKQKLNLPFEVIALSADYIGAFLRGEDPQCVIQDLESDYRILIAEFICQLHNAFCTAGKQKFTPAIRILDPGLFESGNLATKKTTKKTTTAEKNKASAALLSPAVEAVDMVFDHPFISSLVNEFQATAVYTKGDMLSRLCSPASGTTGNYYVTSVKANQGKFINPDPGNATNNAIFEFLDSVESLFQILLTKPLSALDTNVFASQYGVYTKDVHALKDILIVDTVQMILNTCIVEKLEALRNEYLRRLAQYRLAFNFNFYFKKHGGIEHKAGVPRGGTFILVYHEERRKRFVDPHSLYVNKELTDRLLTNFRELLNPDVDLDTQEAKVKLLAVTTLYKDPALYLRFKNVMQEYLDNCHDIPPDKKNEITTIINQPPGNPTYELSDGMVIADFYVPYICRSDCAPIAYILPQTSPDPLTVQQGDPVCDQEGKNYSVLLTVSGGTPPYIYVLNNVTSSNSQVLLPTGSADTDVIIRDSSNQSITTTIKSHQCTQPCDLPCKGIAENCKYVLWLPKPKDKLKDSFKHVTKLANLSLTDENGQVTQIDLTSVFVSIIDNAKITEKTFDGILKKLFAEVNAQVVSKAPVFIGNNQPMFAYDGQTPDKFQNETLNIEHFTPCHSFNLQVEASITNTTQDQMKFSVIAKYDVNIASFEIISPSANFEYKVAKFGCSTIDKCANTQPVSLCKDQLVVKEINAQRDPSGNLSFTFSTAPGEPVYDKYFWYFHIGSPMFSTSASPLISVQTTNPFFVRVVGISSTAGCYAILEQTLNLG